MSALDNELTSRAGAAGEVVAARVASAGVWEAAQVKASRAKVRRLAWRAGLSSAGGFAAAVVAAPVLLGVDAAQKPQPVATGDAMATLSEPYRAPVAFGAMSLACGETLPEVLPGDVELDEGPPPRFATRLVTNTDPVERMPGVTLVGGDFALAGVSVGETASTVTFASTIIQVFEGSIVSSTGYSPSPLGPTVPLVPGSCQRGVADPALVAAAAEAESLGAGLDIHIAVVAYDRHGRVVGRWLNPDGTSTRYLPDLGPRAVDGWCPAA